MTKQDDAVITMEAMAAQVGKIKTEVQSLIDTVAQGGAGDTSPAFDAALNRLQAAITGVDELNPDVVVLPADPV